MTFKTIFFCALVTPFSLFSNGDIETEIKELKAACFKKELELSELGRKINDLHVYMLEEEQRLIQNVGKLFKKKDYDKLDHDERMKKATEFDTNYYACFTEFKQEIEIKKSIKGFLIKNILIKDENGHLRDFDFAKFALIRFDNEFRILKDHLEQYEDLLQELIEIDLKIQDLQNSPKTPTVKE